MGDYKKTKEQLLREIDRLKDKIAKLEETESKRKRVEEALKESEEKFRTIFENAPVFIDAFDKNGKCILWNNECEKTFGWTIEEINSEEDPLSLFYPDTEIREKVRKTISSEPDNKFREWHPLTKDGNQLVTLWASFKVSDGSVISLGYNITEQKHAEQIQKALQNISNAVSTTDNLTNLISRIQKELGTIIDTTNFYVALYDHKTDTFSLPFIADEKDELTSLPAGKTLTKYVITTQKPLLATKERKKELKRSGDIEHFETDSEIWLGVPLKIKGKATCVLAVQSYTDESAYDESDMEMLESIAGQISISINRKKTEQGLINALEKATESDRLKSAFLATISHELRTPLNAIIGFSDIISKDLPIDDIIEFNKTINASGNHLLAIVKDLFDITLIESGEIKIAKENFKLRTILNDVQNIIKAEQEKTNKGNIGLNLVTPPEGEGLIINTDPSKLKQILINLLKNALKFTHEGYINYGYNIEAGHDKPVLKFYIEDTGIGIPKEKQELIFDIFRQVEDSHTRIYGGAGIGLSISKKLAELLGGRIWLESEKGEGSTFYLEIPLDEFEMVSKPIIKETGKDNSLKEKTILIVEDVQVSFEFLKIVLEKSGINIIWAKDGEEAIKLCKENTNIDLVLMDINMPFMNGYEATKKIKKIRPNLPIIAQTAYAIAGDKEKSLEAGCDDYIAKPIKLDILMAKIKIFLGE
ncbi:hypothetical protein MNBD_BACTEROID01-1354 [hydrothermal vent metagenome]|uniref:histidine kinase n=1 Tax=hydrothermal vent metagenome TaxID=652676 RepID=A0A3B0T8V9_9ZZZZ